MAIKIEIEMFEVGEHEPADGALVIAWNESLINPARVVEYRKNKNRGDFYSGEMRTFPTNYIYLSDVIGLAAVQRIRDGWDQRDDRKKRRVLTR